MLGRHPVLGLQLSGGQALACTKLTRLLRQTLSFHALLLVGKLRLQVLPSTKLLNAKVGGKILLAHSEACLLVCLLCLQPRLLFCVELSLRLLKCRLEPRGLDVALLLRQITSSFGFHDGLAATAKRTGGYGLRPALSARNICLTLCFALLDTHHALHVRRHVRIGSAGLCKRLGAHALRRTHLEVLQVLRLHAIRTKLPRRKLLRRLELVLKLARLIGVKAVVLVLKLTGAVARVQRTLRCSTHQAGSHP